MRQRLGKLEELGGNVIPDLRQVPAVSLASISANKNFLIKLKQFF